MGKKNQTSFKPGHQMGGRPALPPVIKEISRETKPHIIAAYWKLANLPVDKAVKYKPANMIEAGIRTCLVAFKETGKTDQIRHIWAECHGKPVESVDIQGNLETKIEIEFVNADSDTGEAQ